MLFKRLPSSSQKHTHTYTHRGEGRAHREKEAKAQELGNELMANVGDGRQDFNPNQRTPRWPCSAPDDEHLKVLERLQRHWAVGGQGQAATYRSQHYLSVLKATAHCRVTQHQRPLVCPAIWKAPAAVHKV